MQYNQPMLKNISWKVWPSAFYFLYYGAGAALFPYQALYFDSLGLTGSQTGLLLSIGPLIGLVASPFWTGLADARQRHLSILILSMLVTTVSVALVPIADRFAVLVGLYAVQAFFLAPAIALVDSATMTMLGGARDMYGRIRLWGALGWGLVAPAAGWLLQLLGLQWAFWLYASMLAFNLLVVGRLRFSGSDSLHSFSSGLRALLTDRRWIVFLFSVFIAGIGLAAANNYLFVLMSSLGAGETLMGFSLTISIISEVPVMFFGNRLLGRFGARGLLKVALLFTALRSVLFYFAGSPAAILAIQLMHGFTFPALWLAAVKYAADNAPPGLGATAQGLLGAVMWGVGASVGGLLGGILMEWVGAAAMYGILGLLMLTGLGAFMLFERGQPASVTNSL